MSSAGLPVVAQRHRPRRRRARGGCPAFLAARALRVARTHRAFWPHRLGLTRSRSTPSCPASVAGRGTGGGGRSLGGKLIAAAGIGWIIGSDYQRGGMHPLGGNPSRAVRGRRAGRGRRHGGGLPRAGPAARPRRGDQGPPGRHRRTATACAASSRRPAPSAALNHPNILSVYDVGTQRRGAPPYVVTELLEGETLREVLESALADAAPGRRLGPCRPRRASPPRTARGSSTAISSRRTSSSPPRGG